jgi:hypothetical protein
MPVGRGSRVSRNPKKTIDDIPPHFQKYEMPKDDD